MSAVPTALRVFQLLPICFLAHAFSTLGSAISQTLGEFLGGPVVGLHASTSGITDAIPGSETKILHALWPNKVTVIINEVYHLN